MLRRRSLHPRLRLFCCLRRHAAIYFYRDTDRVLRKYFYFLPTQAKWQSARSASIVMTRTKSNSSRNGSITSTSVAPSSASATSTLSLYILPKSLGSSHSTCAISRLNPASTRSRIIFPDGDHDMCFKRRSGYASIMSFIFCIKMRIERYQRPISDVNLHP